MRSAAVISVGLAAFAAAQVDFNSLTCSMEAPHFPRPVNLDQSEIVKAAFRNLTNTLNAAVNGTIQSGWSSRNASFSIAVVSRESKKPIWEYHTRGTGNVNGTKHVDGDSQYYTGSISKLLTVIMMKRSGIDMGKPITEYIPELRNPAAKIEWSKITLTALADHLGGIPTNIGFSEFFNLRDEFRDWGAPDIPTADYGPCSVDGLNKPCTRKQILDAMITMEPVAPPNRRPIYSQISYILMGFALGNYLGNKTFGDALHQILISPLGLQNTGMPNERIDERAVIPPVENWWHTDHGELTPSSGVHSSTNDLSVVVNGILNGTLLTESDFWSWIKPTALASSLKTAVGMPWEIARHEYLTPRYPQIHDVYSKSSAALGYSCRVSLFDQYGLGIVWLTAGDSWAAGLLPSFIMYNLIPAIEEETRRQVSEKYSYLFYNAPAAANGTNGTYAVNSSAVVQMGVTLDSGPGLVLIALTRGTKDVFESLGNIYANTFGKMTGLPYTISKPVRLFPTDLRVKAKTKDGRDIIREDWRIKFDPVIDPARLNGWNGTALPLTSGEGDSCSSWVNEDWADYGGAPVEKVVFIKDAATGAVIGADLPWLRANLTVDRTKPLRSWW